MRNNIKALAIILSSIVVLAAGGAYAYIELPWRYVPGSVVGALLSVRSLKLPEQELPREPRVRMAQGRLEPVDDLERTDTSPTVPMIEVTAPPTEPVADPVDVAPPPGPAEPVDYSRLSDDVILVATTLDHFNQKLLRLIAQARAAQQIQRGETPGAQLAASEPVPAPEPRPEPELSQ